MSPLKNPMRTHPLALTSAYVSVATHIGKKAQKWGLAAKLVSGFSKFGFLLERRKETG